MAGSHARRRGLDRPPGAGLEALQPALDWPNTINYSGL